jgi:cytidylate kinase
VVRRDRDDSAVSAFITPAPGVTLIDSTHRDVSQVVDAVLALIPANA